MRTVAHAPASERPTRNRHWSGRTVRRVSSYAKTANYLRALPSAVGVSRGGTWRESLGPGLLEPLQSPGWKEALPGPSLCGIRPQRPEVSRHRYPSGHLAASFFQSRRRPERRHADEPRRLDMDTRPEQPQGYRLWPTLPAHKIQGWSVQLTASGSRDVLR